MLMDMIGSWLALQEGYWSVLLPAQPRHAQIAERGVEDSKQHLDQPVRYDKGKDVFDRELG